MTAWCFLLKNWLGLSGLLLIILLAKLQYKNQLYRVVTHTKSFGNSFNYILIFLLTHYGMLYSNVVSSSTSALRRLLKRIWIHHAEPKAYWLVGDLLEDSHKVTYLVAVHGLLYEFNMNNNAYEACDHIKKIHQSERCWIHPPTNHRQLFDIMRIHWNVLQPWNTIIVRNGAMLNRESELYNYFGRFK